METLQPAATSTIDHIFRELGDEALVFNKRSKRTIYLNPSAVVIWKLCDGHRTAEEISTLIRDAYPEVPDEFAADVRSAIDAMVSEGALGLAERH